jgi:hypothetical protein
MDNKRWRLDGVEGRQIIIRLVYCHFIYNVLLYSYTCTLIRRNKETIKRTKHLIVLKERNRLEYVMRKYDIVTMIAAPQIHLSFVPVPPLPIMQKIG